MHREDGSELVVRWLDHLTYSRKRSAGTVYRYATSMRSWLALLDGMHPFDADTPMMEAWTQRPARKGARASASTKNDVWCLRSFYGWAFEQQLTQRDMSAALHSPTVHNMQPKPVPDDVWLHLVRSQMSDSLRLALYLGYYSGLRRAEIRSLSPSQVGPDKFADVVRKGGDADIIEWGVVYEWQCERLPLLTVGDDYPTLLLRSAASQSRWLIPWGDEATGCDPQSFNKRLTTLCNREGITPSITPHQLRHSCATNLLVSGMAVELVAHFLNHSSVDITRRYLKLGGGYLSKHLDRLRAEMRGR